VVRSEVTVDPALLPIESELVPRASRIGRLSVALRHRSLLTGCVIALAIIILCAGAPLFTHYSPISQDPNISLAKPSAAHLMGADEFGRDVLSRVLYGGRYTLLASFAVALIGALIGSGLGLLAGYFGGLAGLIIMRIMDLLLVFPGILLALVVSAILGPGLINGVFAVIIVSIPVYGRVVEGATVEVRSIPYMDAARATGAGRTHIMRRHVLPNVAPGIVVLATSWLGVATLWITGLGFLGLGLQPPTPEWGATLNDGADFMSIAWWISFFPGLFLTLYIVGVNLIGDGLRDIQDPTLHKF
jgi:ABC-type dipeptide/oligopeptide/nickel transport system permease subunit